jgi:hypothetical protein
MFVESVCGFKSQFYIVRPKTQTGINADKTIKRNEDDIEKTKYVFRFPMSWT